MDKTDQITRYDPDTEQALRYATTVAYVRGQYPDYLIQDASEDLIVKVRPRDVEKSIPGDPLNCAFACAVKRQLHTTEVIVTQRTMMIIYHHQRLAIRYRSPNKISKLVANFDGVGKMPAGDYRFKKVEASAALGSTRERKSGPHNGKRERKVTVIKQGYRHWVYAVAPKVGENMDDLSEYEPVVAAYEGSK